MRPTWDDTFLAVAKIMAERAICTRRQVGAVIVKDNRIIATGYNGTPPGEPHCGAEGGCWRGQMPHVKIEPGSDYNQYPCSAVHAEANAIIRAGHAACKGGTIYVTCAPCQQCDNMIKAAEIKKVVILSGS